MWGGAERLHLRPKNQLIVLLVSPCADYQFLFGELLIGLTPTKANVHPIIIDLHDQTPKPGILLPPKWPPKIPAKK